MPVATAIQPPLPPAAPTNFSTPVGPGVSPHGPRSTAQAGLAISCPLGTPLHSFVMAVSDASPFSGMLQVNKEGLLDFRPPNEVAYSPAGPVVPPLPPTVIASPSPYMYVNASSVTVCCAES